MDGIEFSEFLRALKAIELPAEDADPNDAAAANSIEGVAEGQQQPGGKGKAGGASRVTPKL